MKKIFVLTLGLITAVGGFIDIGDVVFASQAGAKFSYSLLWALVLGTGGIMIFSEMSGRTAAIAKLTTFDIIRRDYPRWLGFATLVLSIIVTFMTCAAEIGGVALILQLLSGFALPLLIIVALAALLCICWFISFSGIEKLFGYLGLGVLVFLVAAIKTSPDLSHVAHNIMPHVSSGNAISYWYFAVGLIAASLMPYEIYFYSSGGIEERWKDKNLMDNRINSYFGFGLGALIVVGIMVASANILMPANISPDFIGTALLPVLGSMGQIGLLLALLGLLFSIGGAAVETSFSAAYNLSQYAGWKWGRRERPLKRKRFSAVWVTMLVLGAVVALTGVDPVKLTEYAVIFSVVVMPLTFYPVLKTARDKKLMGKHANGKILNGAAHIYFAIIIAVSLAAIPLMVLSNQGKG